MKNKPRHKSFIQFNSFPNCAVFTPQLPFTPQVSLLLSCLPSFAFFIPLLSSLLNCRYPQLYSLLSCLHSSAASLFSCLHFSASSTTLPYASTVFPPQLSSLLSCFHFSKAVYTPQMSLPPAVFSPQLSSLLSYSILYLPLTCLHSSTVSTPQLLHSSAVFTSQRLHFLAVFASQLFLLRSCLHSSDVFIP